MKSTMKFLTLCILISISINAKETKPKSSWHVKSSISIKSNGGWDYIAVNPVNGTIYVSHGTQVNIVSPTGDSVGIIENTMGVHGIAFAPKYGKGYTTNGKTSDLTVFDINTNKVLGRIKVGDKPDAIMYDAYTDNLIVCNGKSKDISFVDAQTGQLMQTVALGGKPETAVSDNHGKIFVNIEDKDEIIVINAKNYTIEAHWPLHAKSPTGLAIDVKTHRLFAGCDDKKLVIINSQNGKIVKVEKIGNGCDGIAFDDMRKLIFSANGEDGTLSIIKEVNADSFKSLPAVVTTEGTRTLVYDDKTRCVLLPAADFEKSKKTKDHHRPGMISGSFKVLVVGE
jgi:DNA-binding beta-propeller fold protein YncE